MLRNTAVDFCAAFELLAFPVISDIEVGQSVKDRNGHVVSLDAIGCLSGHSISGTRSRR